MTISETTSMPGCETSRSAKWAQRVRAILRCEFFVCALIGVLVSACFLKALEFGNFTNLVSRTGLVAETSAPWAAGLILGTEALAVVALIAGPSRVATILTGALGCGIVVFAAWRLRSGYAAPCGCFGSLLELSASQSMAFGLGALVFSFAQWSAPPRPFAWRRRAPFAVLAACCACGAYFLKPSPVPPDKGSVVQASGVYLRSSSANTVQKGRTYSVSFSLTNTNKKEVEVEAIPSCGCVRGSWRSAHIRPAETVSYQTSGPKPEFVLFRISSPSLAYLYGQPSNVK